MAVARKFIVDTSGVGVYHCISRCVRRAFLCGYDQFSGKDYEHRRGWMQKRLKKLTSVFAIEVFAYSVMSNHTHVILRNRPDIASEWGAKEIAEKWVSIFGRREFKDEKNMRQAAEWLAQDELRIQELRGRLSDVSWFMRCLNEYIARRANKEDECRGRFWEGRFKCQKLLDDSAVLSCMAYIDLNPIRAGIAKTPESSDYTSGQDRFIAKQSREKIKKIFDENRNPKTQKVNLSKEQWSYVKNEEEKALSDNWLTQITAEKTKTHKNRKCYEGIFDNFTVDQYLKLIDWTGRHLRSDKPGAIPEHLSPILDRMNIDNEKWLTTVRNYGTLFHRVSGRLENIIKMAESIGQKWFCGIKPSRLLFSGKKE